MSIRCQPMPLQLKQPFRISHSVFTKLDHLLLSIHARGVSAFGEVAPLPFFNENYAIAERQISYIIEHHSSAIIRIEDREQLVAFVCTLSEGPYLKCVVCGFEMLLLDYVGKLLKKPAWSLLQVECPRPRESAVTLPICERGAVGALTDIQLPLVKLKLGGKDDLALLDYIRNEGNPGQKYIIDMNRGWTLEELATHRDRLAHESILFVEEPVAVSSIDIARKIADLKLEVPVFLDESVTSEAELHRYLPFIDGVNIKIIKMGGLLKSLSLIDAVEGQLDLLLGCFLESSLSIAYAYQISAKFKYADLDGASFIGNDHFSGLRFHDGQIGLPDDYYGLGVQYV
ncbi:enolase C-terminal domain-like protein [Paenibacillus tianjinensis]|uniref:Enolase C-terminal domain-containing protein n=1 Tax=Paenibacillus tianjinensis TaxID=2810347 RepID=A0ABX7L849_9BACL|nr:enolase C-terminal domain-like protein [Paenibacillus tianjinensis]QSF44385.1 hypothetical protein JRJ22_24765 [Paenibacillus tianjinensis]